MLALISLMVMAVFTGTSKSLTDGLSCAVDTAWTSNKTAGVITSPNYPNNYPTSQACTWSFRLNDNYQVVVIEIIELIVIKAVPCDTSYCASNMPTKCVDHLTLQEGNPGRQMIICGDSPPPICFVLKHVTTQVQNTYGITSACMGTIRYVDTISSPNNIYFYSNSENTRKGFSLKFNVVNVAVPSTTTTTTTTTSTTTPTKTTTTKTATTTTTTQPTTTTTPTTNTAIRSTTTTSIPLSSATTSLKTSPTTSSKTTPPVTTTVKENSSPGVTAAASYGGIIGVVVGVVVGLIFIIVLVFFLRCRKQNKPTKKLPLHHNITNRSPAYQTNAPQPSQNGHMVDNVIYDTSEAAVYVNTRENKALEPGSNSVVPPSNKPDDLYAVVDKSNKKERQVVDNVLYDGFQAT